MLKRILCTFLCALIILIPLAVIPASADDTTATEHGGSSGSFGDDLSNVNLWDYNMWSDILPEGYQLPSDIDNYVGYQSQFFYGYTSEVLNSYAYVDFWNSGMTFTNNDKDIGLCSIGVAEPTDVYSLYVDRIDNIFSKKYENVSGYLWTLDNQIASDESKVFIVNDLSVYKSMVADMGSDEDKTIYYCDNIIQSLVDYVTIGDLEFNKVVAPEGFTNTGIKYSDSLDSPYGKYLFKPYEDEQENLVTAGLFSDLDIYYDSEFNRGSSYDHSETIDFYIDVSDAFTEEFGNTLFDYYNYKWDLPDMTDFFNKHFKSIHYDSDAFNSLDFFRLSNSNITSINDVLSIAKVEDSYFLKFSLLSEYSVTYNIGVEPGTSNMTNSILTFLGSKVTHSCTHIGNITGEIGNGLGSDISQADDSLSRPPTKDELKNFGFEYGYPNTAGSYPYKLTIYRNGQEYFQMYFSKMPSVTSTYYTDKCIDYGINVSNMKIYMYFKEQHMSKLFNFTNDNSDVYNSDLVNQGGFYDEIMFKPIDDYTGRLLNALLGVNVSEFNNTYTLHFWTNYTGTFENMNGFYCKFNWDLESSGHFQRVNSDDDYDYSQDYDVDEGFTDNNGNIHGGAVETPTESSDYNGFNNEDFSFDENNLWKYADSFLGFCARAFKVLPSFIWQLIGCSIVIVIVLRIVGR